MIFQYICPPASLYLAFSIIQILIDMFRGEMDTAFLKFLVMIIFTIALNMLCASGLGIISWFIVFIPFILMTYITTILVFVFGIPKTSDLRPERERRPERKPRNEHNRDWWRKHHEHIGGCAGTRFGCCDDGETAKKNYQGSNCPSSPRPHHHKDIIGGCAGTRFGCCPDNKTAKKDKIGNNCCDTSKYGCCNDGISKQPCPSGTSLVLDPEQSLSPEKLAGGCAKKKYGCCSDGSAAVAKACGVLNPVI
jgi:hypothetical protein